MQEEERILTPESDAPAVDVRFDRLASAAKVLVEAESFDAAIPAVLESVREGLIADIAVFWRHDVASDLFRFAGMSGAGRASFSEFRAECSGVAFRDGEGLSGLVCATRAPRWLEDLPGDRDLPHMLAAADAGLDAAAAFPVMHSGLVVGVVELFAGRPLPRDDQTVRMMEVIGGLLGQCLRREEAQTASDRAASAWQDFVDNAAVALHCVGPDGRILWANSAELEMLGYARDEYIGRHITEFHADPDVIEDILKRLQAGEELRDYEARLRRRDGSIRYVSISSNVYRDNGEFVHTRCFTRDITDRKLAEAAHSRAETQFASFMKHLPGAAWIKDAEGRYQYANEYAQRIFHTPMERLDGKTDFEIFPEETARQFHEHDRQAIEQQGIQRVEQLEHDDGVVHDSIVSKFPIYDERGHVVSVGGIAVDITEWKQVEAALRDSEQRNNATFSSPAVGICEVDLEGRFLRANDAFCRITGYSEDELLRLSFQDITYAEDVSADTEQYLRLQAGEIDRYSLEKRYIHKSGRAIWVALNVSLARDARGRPAYGIGIVVDVTERRLADEAKSYLAAIVENSDDAIIGKTLDGRVTSWNRGAERLYGYTAEEMIGESIARIIPAKRSNELREILGRLRAGEEFPNFETRRRRKDGRIINVSLSISPIRDSQGRTIGASAIARDLTEWVRRREALRESEQRFRGLFKEFPAAVCTCNAEGRLTFFNDAAITLWGRTPEVEKDLWCGSWKMYRPDGKPLAHDKCPMALALKHGRPYRGREFVVERTDGERRYVMAYPEPTFNESGAVTGAVNMLVDITKRKRAEESLQEARRQAEAANQSKSEFLANISHEIRTPMTAILGYADILGENLTDTSHQEQVDIIRRNGNYLLEIINDVLELSRIEAGGLEIERGRFRPDELLFEVCKLMEVRTREKGLNLELEFHGRIPETIESDPTRLRQVLINLVGNAIKFTKSGEVRLAARLIENERKLRLDVIDTGIGIQEDQLERLFEPFTQADSSVTRQYGGSGVGLAISQRLTAMLGGDISVHSTPGRGSVFSVTIDTGPLDDVPLIEARRRPSLLAEFDEPASPPLGCHVLVVDDQRDIRHLLRRCIDDAGGEVTSAENGREALSVVEECRRSGRPVEIVLLDMQMPVMDGYEAAAKLRESGFTGRIVALTASAMQGDSEKCLRAGCDDYITKPVDRGEMIETIHRHTRGTGGRPRTQSSADPEADAGCEQGACAGNDATKDAMRVLLVEDNTTVSRMMRMLLESRGYRVRVAGDGASALESAAGFRPNVVLLDLGLPDMSGYDVATQLRETGQLKECILIALSGSGEPQDKDRSRQAGFHDHLVKPASIDELERILANCGSVTGTRSL